MSDDRGPLARLRRDRSDTHVLSPSPATGWARIWAGPCDAHPRAPVQGQKSLKARSGAALCASRARSAPKIWTGAESAPSVLRALGPRPQPAPAHRDHENIPAHSTSDWSVMSIYLHILRLIGPS
eukprot:8274667-Pyramimonas_sp.AAC.1